MRLTVDGILPAESRRDVLDGLINIAFLGVVFYFMFILMDYRRIDAFFPRLDESAQAVYRDFAYMVRGIVILILMVSSYLLYRERIRPAVPRVRIIVLGAFCQLVLATGILALMYRFNAFGTNYFCGLIMVMLVISMLTPWHPWITTLQICLIFLLYAIVATVYFFEFRVGGVKIGMPNGCNCTPDNFRNSGESALENIAFLVGAGVLAIYGALFRHTLADPSRRSRWTLVSGGSGDGDPTGQGLLSYDSSYGGIRKVIRITLTVATPVLAAFAFLWLIIA